MRQIKPSETWYAYVYLLESNGFYKIGFSHEPGARVRRLQTGSPTPIRLVHVIRTPHFRHLEEVLHIRFGEKRVRREWFALDDADVAHIKTLNAIGRTPEEEARIEAGNAAFRASQEYKDRQTRLSEYLDGSGPAPWTPHPDYAERMGD